MSEQTAAIKDNKALVTTPEQAIRSMFEMCTKVDFTDLIKGVKPTLEIAKGFEMELQRIYQLALSGLAKDQAIAPKEEVKETVTADSNQTPE